MLVYVKFVKTRRKKILKMKITFYLFVLSILIKRKPGSKIPPNFNELPEVEKFRMVLNKPENVKYTVCNQHI